MKKVGWEFEDEVLPKDSVGEKISIGKVNLLVDTPIDFWIEEFVVMLKEPAHGIERAGGFLAVVDAIGRGWETRDGTNMGQDDAFESFFTSS